MTGPHVSVPLDKLSPATLAELAAHGVVIPADAEFNKAEAAKLARCAPGAPDMVNHPPALHGPPLRHRVHRDHPAVPLLARQRDQVRLAGVG